MSSEKITTNSIISTYIDISPLAYNLYDLIKDTLLVSTKDPMDTIGIPRDELIKMSHNYYKEIIHPDDYPMVKANFEKMKESDLGDQVEQVFRVRHGQGHYVWLHTIYRIYEVDAQGKASKMAGIAEDVTTLKLLETELKDAVETLLKINHRDAHVLRGPVATILGLMNIIEQENIIHSTNLNIFGHLRKTVEKLDQVVTQIYRQSLE